MGLKSIEGNIYNVQEKSDILGLTASFPADVPFNQVDWIIIPYICSILFHRILRYYFQYLPMSSQFHDFNDFSMLFSQWFPMQWMLLFGDVPFCVQTPRNLRWSRIRSWATPAGVRPPRREWAWARLVTAPVTGIDDKFPSGELDDPSLMIWFRF